MSVETRQHELFNVDLGEGVPRKALVAGMVVMLAWWALLGLILGMPTAESATLYILPPALVTLFGWRESERNPRRRNITEWVLAGRWITTGHRPVIGLGRQGSPAHQRSVIARIGDRLGNGDALALLMPWRIEEGTKASKQERPHAGRGERLGGRVQMVGTEAAAAMRERKTKGKGKSR